MSRILVTGAGGFIGGHLVKRLLNDKHKIIAVDIKPLNKWFQKFKKSRNISFDLKNYNNCLKITKNIENICEIYGKKKQ